MKSSILSAEEFFQLTVNSLLELCTNSIDGHRIVSIEGRLILSLDTGDKVELNILQQDVSNLLKFVKDEDTDESPLSVTSDVDKNPDVDLPLNTEAALAADDSIGLESLNSMHMQQTESQDSVNETYLHSSSTEESWQSFPDAEGVPTAVMQPNGQFRCSSCGETMETARAIKRHISEHTSLQSFRPSITPCLEKADKTHDVSKATLIKKQPKRRVRMLRKSINRSGKRFQKPEYNADNSQQWRSYPCKDCDGKLFTTSALLQLHRVQMHRPHKCEKCSMVLIGQRSFSQHVRKEHPGLPISKAQKSFVCEYCSRTFGDESQLKDHISTIHLGATEHRCDKCGKVLGSAMTLRIHQRQLHERACERTCDGCGRQFTRLAGLINHLTCSHPHLLPEKYRSRLDELSCKECHVTFSRRSSLQRHCEIRHGGAPRYVCSICSRRFRCRRYVLRHFRCHHPATTATTAAHRSAMIIDVGDDDNTFMSDILEQSADVDSSAT